jgi:hypothetical protein
LIIKVIAVYKKMGRYGESLESHGSRVTHQDSAIMKDYRKHRDTTSSAMRNCSVPTALAKVYADWWHGYKDAFQLVPQKDHELIVPPFTEQTDLACFFMEPFSLPLGYKDEKNPWAAASTEYYEKVKSHLHSETAVKARGCCERSINHSHHYQLDTSKVPMWPWDAADFFKPAEGVQVCLHLARKYSVDVRWTVTPARGQRAMLQGCVGSLLVCVVMPEIAFGMLDPCTELQSAGHAFLASCPCYLVHPGDCVYSPPGGFHVVMGVELETTAKGSTTQYDLKVVKNRRLHKPEEYVSYTIHACFDIAADSRHSAATQHYLVQSYHASSGAFPQELRALPSVKAWADQLGAAPEAAAQAPAPKEASTEPPK